MTHLTPFRVLPRRSIRIRESKCKTRCTLHIWTIDIQGRLLFSLRFLEPITEGNRSMLLAIVGSYETLWIEVIDDLVNYVCFLEAGKR